jgi:hypothetical protein
MENLLINPDNCGSVHLTSLYRTSIPRKSIRRDTVKISDIFTWSESIPLVL